MAEEQPAKEQPADQSMKFFKCPSCGSEKRIIESVVNEEVSKGNLREGARATCIMTKTTIFEPAGAAIIAPKKIPIVECFFDVCADCGNLYCTEMRRTTGFAQPQVRRDNFQLRP